MHLELNKGSPGNRRTMLHYAASEGNLKVYSHAALSSACKNRPKHLHKNAHLTLTTCARRWSGTCCTATRKWIRWTARATLLYTSPPQATKPRPARCIYKCVLLRRIGNGLRWFVILWSVLCFFYRWIFQTLFRKMIIPPLFPQLSDVIALLTLTLSPLNSSAI